MTSAPMMQGAIRPMERLFRADEGTVAGLDDASLWDRFAARHDQAAFEALVARHGPMVLRAARAILEDHHAAEDVVQTTFVALARRGGSIRRHETLAPWLHRVATREAIRLRRRSRRQAEHDRQVEPRRTDPAISQRAELIAAVHAELDRLPESYRVPIVLCDLEGWTKASAAVHLGWTEGAVRGRLERGRARLRGQLARQGFAPTVGSLAALLGSATEASAAVGGLAARQLAPRLVAVVARAALASNPVTGWAGRFALARSMLRPRLGVVGGGVGPVALGIGGLAGLAVILGWAGSDAPRLPAPPAGFAAADPSDDLPLARIGSPPRPTLAQGPAPAPEAAKPGDLVEIHGRVVEPASERPVPGALVRVRPHVGMLPAPADIVASADPQGRFAVGIPRHLLHPESRDSVIVVASAPGFGLGYRGIGTLPNRDDIIVPLTTDAAPLDGYVADDRDQPIANALVRVDRLFAPTDGDLTPWADRVRRNGTRGTWEGTNWRLLVDLGAFPDLTARTDAQGHFRIPGLGQNRVAELIITGPGCATAHLAATTQAAGPIVAPGRGERQPALTFEANRFRVVLPAGRTVEGVIRDADTGRPIAGIPLRGHVVEENNWNVPRPGIEGISDPAGRYRLSGLPEAEQYRVFVRPEPGQPYPDSDIATPLAGKLPPGEPIRADLTLRRGVVVRGRVTNGRTGQPVVNAAITAYARKGNPELDHYPGMGRSPLSDDRTDADGRYEVVALPGRGLLTVVGLGAFKIPRDFEGMDGYDPDRREFATTPPMGNLAFCNAVVSIQPTAGSSPTMDITVDPGGSVAGKLVDPAGQPLVGTVSVGLQPGSWLSDANPTDRFEVRGLRTDEARRIYFYHRERGLAGSTLVHAGDTGLVVSLVPAGTIAGRLVDADGKPLDGMSLTQLRDDIMDLRRGRLMDNATVYADAGGRFRADFLIPGLLYKAYPSHDDELRAVVLDDLAVLPGEVKDLGDVVVRPFPRP